MSQYQIPRQPTTRVEFLPGVGLLEAFAAGVTGLVGYGLALLLEHFELGSYSFYLVAGFGLAGFFVIQGGQGSLLSLLQRQNRFQRTQQQMLFRLGTGGESVTHQAQARKGKKQKLSKSVQAWLPIKTVQSGVIQRTDGSCVAVIQVEPVNLGLCSPSEQQRLLALLHEAINALQHPAQILSVPRPLDLDAYVKALEARQQEIDPGRQQILRLYTHYVSSMITSGEVRERRFFILLPQPPGLDADREVLQRAHDLTARLRQANLHAKVLDEQELFDLLYVWAHPNQAAFERPPAGPPAFAILKEE